MRFVVIKIPKFLGKIILVIKNVFIFLLFTDLIIFVIYDRANNKRCYEI